MENVLWGLDIGGTKCALCVADETGKILSRRQVATREYPRWEALMDALLSPAEQEGPLPAAVGVSCGSPLDARRGLILSPPNLPGWDAVPITEYLQKRLSAPAYLQNDANACALAEWRFGAGQGCRNMIFLTFGTGMGAGLILDGRLYEGTNGMAGETGHMRLSPDGPEGYGKRGSMEGFCSGGGLRQLALSRLGLDLSAKELAQRAEMGDSAAAGVLAESGRRLGQGLAILIDLFNPERIVIGSIFARAGKWFRPAMQAEIEREALEINRGACQVLPAALGDRIGDVAAISIALYGKRSEKE